LYILAFKKKEFVKYLLIGLFGLLIMVNVAERYSDNYAIRRLLSTFEMAEDNRGGDVVGEVAGSRAVEVESILEEMDGIADYMFGKGFGFVYHFVFNETDKMHANA